MDNEVQLNTPQSPPLSQSLAPILTSTNWIKLIFFLLYGIVIIACSVFIGFQIGLNQKPRQKPVAIQPTASPTRILVSPTALPATTVSVKLRPTTNPIENWKTYSNPNTKIVFKYPSSLSIADITQGTGMITKIIGLEEEISLTVEPNTEHDLYASSKVSETLVLNNIAWSYLTEDTQYCDAGECGGISNALRTTNQGKRYTIVLGNLTMPEDTLSQILSTFNFTN